MKNNTEDELPDEAEDPQDQNNDRQDDTGQEQEARKQGLMTHRRKNSPETEQKKRGADRHKAR